MKWEKKGKQWVAKGANGKFVITKYSIYYKASYSGKQAVFNLPWKRSIKEVKQMCQDNYYWED